MKEHTCGLCFYSTDLQGRHTTAKWHLLRSTNPPLGLHRTGVPKPSALSAGMDAKYRQTPPVSPVLTSRQIMISGDTVVPCLEAGLLASARASSQAAAGESSLRLTQDEVTEYHAAVRRKQSKPSLCTLCGKNVNCRVCLRLSRKSLGQL